MAAPDDKKGHVCPPSNATHPSDRWETLFVYSFICKFTTLRGKPDGLNTPMDFEDALLQPLANPVMTQILTRFIQNLRPQTRNPTTKQLNETLASVLSEYFKTSERSVFWDDSLQKNINPLTRATPDFFSAEWDVKLKILRQLVEFQLSHSTDIKALIDRAWGITQNKEKRKGAANIPTLPDATDPHSQESLLLAPIGQDASRKRYWVVDDSPRVWTSTNPWKMSAAFQCISSTRDEYMFVVAQLKASQPTGSKKTKQEQGHITLFEALDARVEAIDAELARIGRAKKKAQQKLLLIAQAELRTTRTRRQTKRPDYYNFGDDDEQQDEDSTYNEQPDGDSGPDDEDDATSSHSGRRRSGRTSGRKTNDTHSTTEWRGERRSSRLGDSHLDDGPPAKRARTEDSMTSEELIISTSAASVSDKSKSAAVLKPTETAVEQLAGKKKNKYWFYAVEPIANGGAPAPPPPLSSASSGTPASVPANGEEEDVDMGNDAEPNGY